MIGYSEETNFVSIKKTIKILDWWINQKKEGVLQIEKDWNFSNDFHGIG